MVPFKRQCAPQALTWQQMEYDDAQSKTRKVLNCTCIPPAEVPMEETAVRRLGHSRSLPDCAYGLLCTAQCMSHPQCHNVMEMWRCWLLSPSWWWSSWRWRWCCCCCCSGQRHRHWYLQSSCRCAAPKTAACSVHHHIGFLEALQLAIRHILVQTFFSSFFFVTYWRLPFI